PNRSLSYPKIMQGESNGKRKPTVFRLALLNRSLSYPKIVQGESNGKRKPTINKKSTAETVDSSPIKDDET
ncbi:MAG: hypothetical protein SOZ05_09050, partial [Muribaculaceae bacterium]|nr:hypothetical protein [Muribaculaceae bacterium]